MKYLIIALIFAMLLTTGCTPVNDSASIDEGISEEKSEPENQAFRDLLSNAEAITKQMIEYSIPSRMIRDRESIGESEIWRFLMCTFVFEDSPYYQLCDFSEMSDKGIVKYHLAHLQIIAYELFGIENWFFNPDGNFSEDTNQFSVHRDQGLRQDNFISDVKSEMIDNEYISIECTYSCYISYNGDPLLSEIGTYRCLYKIETEDDNTFLRLESYGLLNDRYDVKLNIIEDSFTDGCYTKFVLTADSDEIYFDGLCAATRRDGYKLIVTDVTGDDVPDISVIFTAGTGTGMNIEDIHIFDGITHNQYEVRNAVEIVKEQLILSSDDECYRITSDSGELIINKSELDSPSEYLADLPFFNMICRYVIKDGCLYSYMPIQVGITEYYNSGNIEVKYRLDTNVFDAESVKINETAEIFPQY